MVFADKVELQNDRRSLYTLEPFPWNKFPSLSPTIEISARANGRPRSRLRMLDGSARPPIDTSGSFPAHVSAESPLNTSPNPSEVIS